MKKHLTGKDGVEKLLVGVQKTAGVVKETLGPKGRNAVLDRKFGAPLITNDGVSIAREFELEDEFENVGCKLIKEVCQKTNALAGDGTTTAIVLAEEILSKGFEKMADGTSPVMLGKGINKAKDLVVSKIKEIAKPLSSPSEIEQVATISCGDEEIGKLISKACSLMGNGNILLGDSKTDKTELVYEKGMVLQSGLISPYLATNIEKSVAEFEDCYLLLTDQKISKFSSLLPLLEKIVQVKKPLLIVCDDIELDALSPIIVNKMRGTFDCCVIKAPLYGDKRIAKMEDISCMTGATIITKSKNMNLEDISLDDLGILKNVKVTKDSTILLPKNHDDERLEKRKKFIEEQINACTNDFDKEQLKKRLGSLGGGVATINVGAPSDIAQKEKKLRIEDAISATSSAIDGGIVCGGGITLLKIAKEIAPNKKAPMEEKIGFEIVREALVAPIRQILKNAGVEEEFVISKIMKAKRVTFGFDALKGKFCDMMTSGIVDPAKVTISALESAVSVATTMLTTSSIVVEI